MDISEAISTPLQKKRDIWYGPKGGYWSNLARMDNESFVKELNSLGARGTVKKYFPKHEQVIFSLKRMGGAATLDFSDNDVILDAGCMWGALAVPVARTGAKVIATDQTEESLLLLSRRKEEEGLDNLQIVCADLKKINFKDKVFDKTIVNGVLEWVPEENEIEVNKFVKRNTSLLSNLKLLFKKRSRGESPKQKQKEFLQKICRSLKDDGVLYLAIENRFDFFYFLGSPEQHSGIRFIAFLPRWMQNMLSIVLRGRTFRTWTYSRRELKSLLRAAGFAKCNFYYGFPTYLEPELVLTDKGMDSFWCCRSAGNKPIVKKTIMRIIEYIVYKKLKLTFFAPSFIVHAYK